MGAIDSSSGRRFLAGFVTLAVISGITLGIAKVTTTLYALSLQATPLELALLGAAQSVGILAVSLPVGLMVDRYGARRLFVIGSLLVTVLYALIPAWGRLGFLLACTTAVSFAMPPTMQPEVTTSLPFSIASIIARCSFAFFCCGRISRK